jgi:hypothetical protein
LFLFKYSRGKCCFINFYRKFNGWALLSTSIVRNKAHKQCFFEKGISSLFWDVTVVDTLADSYVLKTSEVSGFAAEMACKRKHNKYRSIISSNYIFKGLAFETLGPWCKETIDFINVIGDRLIRGIRGFKI